jgi:hypothetical protein
MPNVASLKTTAYGQLLLMLIRRYRGAVCL